MSFTVKIWKEEDTAKEIKTFEADSEDSLEEYLSTYYSDCEWEIM